VRVPPKLVHATATIAARGDGTLTLGVVADTHSQPNAAGLAHLAASAPDAILHGGDIGELGVLDQLAAIAPVYAVRGNIDTRARDLPDVLVIDAAGVRLLLTHIAVYGPRLRAEVAKLARSERANLVVCGHSHVPFIGVDKGITVFNPGSIGPRRFSLPILFGTIVIGPAGVKLAHLAADTGQRWLPPRVA
jgi:uncharacterized protein